MNSPCRPKLQKANVLVTGGAGFIGSHLCESLANDYGCRVVALDNLFLGTKLNLTFPIHDGEIIFIDDDASDYQSVAKIISDHSISTVFNLATHPLNYSHSNPIACFQNSLNIVLVLLELLRERKYQTLCNFSTSEVYGDLIQGSSFDENTPFFPLSVYAAGKASADHAAFSYVKSFGLDVYTIRPFNNYGPRQSTHPALAGIIPNTITRIISGLPPLIKGTGTQKREFIYVKDTVDISLYLHELVTPGDVVGIGRNSSISMLEVINQISCLMNYSGNYSYEAARPADALEHKGCTHKLMDLIDFSFTDFPQGIQKTIDYYLSRSTDYELGGIDFDDVAT